LEADLKSELNFEVLPDNARSKEKKNDNKHFSKTRDHHNFYNPSPRKDNPPSFFTCLQIIKIDLFSTMSTEVPIAQDVSLMPS